MTTAPAACWCGGGLESSVHPCYGRCRACGTLVARDIPDSAALKSFYGLDAYWRDRAVNVAHQNPIEVRSRTDFGDRIPVWYRTLRRYQPRVRSVLEVACSHGGFLAYCRDRGIPEVAGVEVSAETCAFARRHFDLPQVVEGFFPDVDLPRRAYDAIVAFDLLEHLPDPLSAVRAMRDHLEPGGLLFLQTPCYRGEDAAWAMFVPDEHLFLFDSGNARDLLKRAGLEVTALTRAIFAYDMFILCRRAEDVTPSLRWLDRMKAALPCRRRTTRAERHQAREPRP